MHRARKWGKQLRVLAQLGQRSLEAPTLPAVDLNKFRSNLEDSTILGGISATTTGTSLAQLHKPNNGNPSLNKNGSPMGSRPAFIPPSQKQETPAPEVGVQALFETAWSQLLEEIPQSVRLIHTQCFDHELHHKERFTIPDEDLSITRAEVVCPHPALPRAIYTSLCTSNPRIQSSQLK